MLNPEEFFRLNRQIIIHLKSISAIHDYFSNSLKLELNTQFSEDIIIKRPKTSELKSWLDR